MEAAIGEKIGAGVSADVHAWKPGAVVKLFRPGIPRVSARHEARMIRAAYAGGAPAPQVLGEIECDGRFGIVMERLEGLRLSQALDAGTLSRQEAGAMLARLAIGLHRMAPPPEVLALRDWLFHSLRDAGERIPAHIAGGILDFVDRLPPGGVPCHCDLHGNNVIVTANGPRLVDWIGLMRAPAALELAASHMTMAQMAPTLVANPERPREVYAAMRAEYARLAGIDEAALVVAVNHLMPICRVFVLLGDAWPERRSQLLRDVEIGLGLA